MTVSTWQPGTSYGYGDIVEYDGARYKIIQPHTSQGDWAPPIVPALWGRIPDGEWKDHEPYNPPHDKGDYHSQDVQQPSDYNQHPEQTVDVPHDEQKKKWWDLSGDRKKQLEVGGGLLAGAAALAGGYYAWHEHEKNKKSDDEVSSLLHPLDFYFSSLSKKQALTWGLQGWLRDAQARTEEFRRHGPRAPTTWVLVEGRENIPRSAIEAGRDKDKNPIYIARAYHEDGLQVGKAASVFKQGSVIGYAGRVVELDKFEVLVGDDRAIQWVRFSYQLNLQQLGARPVEGGKEASGAILYIARVGYNGGVHTAKIGEHLPAAHLAFNGTEVLIDDYEVLCYH
ncbi:hypothetical protein B0F90DRAFT_1924052 [Multifurca ochricompacta]|uniref:Chitin-binding type-3 domain-containing protein n=1 Tax=Multifurca ochricompacta TaxID=376703 RepID=A0AAD4QPI7_9AGAM|nr:hypothetical protein B0F90DRAFT_1924052 [Multifurca ochricompacta]